MVQWSKRLQSENIANASKSILQILFNWLASNSARKWSVGVENCVNKRILIGNLREKAFNLLCVLNVYTRKMIHLQSNEIWEFRLHIFEKIINIHIYSFAFCSLNVYDIFGLTFFLRIQNLIQLNWRWVCWQLIKVN